MAALYTIAEAIEIGKGTIGIMADYEAEGALYGTKLVQPQSPKLVAMYTDFMDWGNVDGQDAEGLRLVANHLIWLCGTFGQEVQAGQGGGTVIPITPGAGELDPIEFVVTSSSDIITGGSTLQIDDFIGYNILFNRNHIPENQLDTGGSYFTWNKITGVFTCVPAASAGEEFSITPV